MAGLRVYYEYSVSVSTLNDAGMGPFSSQQFVMTLEDGKVNSYTIIFNLVLLYNYIMSDDYYACITACNVNHFHSS